MATALLVLLPVAIVLIPYAKDWGALRALNLRISRLTARGGNQQVSAPSLISNTGSTPAPEISGGTWIYSDPLTLKALRGRVVLVEFWTFACYNCRNTLPSLKSWDARYRDQGLTIIGVHTPELELERHIENVRSEVAALGIRYPVVTDNDYATWKAYGVQAWPTLFVLDKQGHVRWTHVGEGAYDETEQVIKRLLAEDQASGQWPVVSSSQWSIFAAMKQSHKKAQKAQKD